MRSKVITAFVALALALTAMIGFASSASANYYSGPVNCLFNGVLTANYTPVRLIVTTSGNLGRAYYVQFGTAVGSNSEVIDQVHLHEYKGDWTPVGHSYVQNFPAVKGGSTAAMSTYYSPWLDRTVIEHEQVQLWNEHGDSCTANFSFKG